MLNTEKETIILFNEGEETANILTYNSKLKSKLKKLSKEYPEEVTLERAQGSCASYTIPKNWVSISAPSKERALTDDEREKRSERMKTLRSTPQINSEA